MLVLPTCVILKNSRIIKCFLDLYRVECLSTVVKYSEQFSLYHEIIFLFQVDHLLFYLCYSICYEYQECILLQSFKMNVSEWSVSS